MTATAATKTMAERYAKILRAKARAKEHENCGPSKTTDRHLHWMAEEILTNDFMHPSKAHRWLGFIQGVMVSRGYIDVDIERDVSRPLFTGEEI